MISLVNIVSSYLYDNMYLVDMRKLDNKTHSNFVKYITMRMRSMCIVNVPPTQFLGLLYVTYGAEIVNAAEYSRMSTIYCEHDGRMKITNISIDYKYLDDLGLLKGVGYGNKIMLDSIIMNNNSVISFISDKTLPPLQFTKNERIMKVLADIKNHSNAKHKLYEITEHKNTNTKVARPPNKTLVDKCIIALSNATERINFNLPSTLINNLKSAILYRDVNPTIPVIFICKNNLAAILYTYYPQYIIEGNNSRIFTLIDNNVIGKAVSIHNIKYHTTNEVLVSDLDPEDALHILAVSYTNGNIIVDIKKRSLITIEHEKEIIKDKISTKYCAIFRADKFALELQRRFHAIGKISIMSQIVYLPAKYLSKQ